MHTSVATGPHGQRLALRKLANLANELVEWRSDHEIRHIDKEGGGVFDFVKGLRLAARLIYILKEKLTKHGLDANWGQIMDENGVYLSPECDIIVHTSGHLDRWNGEGPSEMGNVMDFRFIELSHVLAVISCKSYLTSISEKDRRYCERLKGYLKGRKLWLFAECIPKGKKKEMLSKAKKAGHDVLWYLYAWDDKNLLPEQDRPLWQEFLQAVDGLADASRTTP
jgi:hypothetical protein